MQPVRSSKNHLDDYDGIEEMPDRSIMTPEQMSQRAELLSSANSENGFEKVSGVAATLYMEMKKNIKARNMQTFQEAVAIIKEMLRQGKLPCTSAEFMTTLAGH